MIIRWSALLLGTCLALQAGSASAAPADIVRDLAARVGPIVGQASTCQDIAQGRVQTIVDQFREVIRQTAQNDAERDLLTRSFNGYIAVGRSRLSSAQINCQTAERQLAELEQSLSQSNNSAPVLAPYSAAAAIPPGGAVTASMHGVTATEIRLGTIIPFSGVRKESGRQMKLGIDAAFNRANDAGGVGGRMLKLIAADDGYDPNRTMAAVTQLYEKDQVLGFIGVIGTADAAAAIPYTLEHHALFFAPHTGASVVRRDPPDRYVFNYRASDAEEAAAIVRYLIKIRRIPARQIAVVAQSDSYGDDGAAGVGKAFRALGISDPVVRFGFPRASLDVDDAVNGIKLLKPAVKAVILIGPYRSVAKFIEKTHDVVPGLIYATISSVGPSSLASELSLLGPKYTNGVIITQGVPSVAGYSSLVLEYKNALAKYFPGEDPDYTSLEGYIGASVLIQALKQTSPLDMERLVDTLESMRNLDLGLGTPLSFGRAEHQASHKIWGTALDQKGTYQPIELE